MARYRSLKSIFHEYDEAEALSQLEKRKNSESALRWKFPVGSNELFVLCIPELLGLIESIGREQAELERMWAQLHPQTQGHYLRTLLMDEIQSTNEIEDIRSTRQELAAALESAEHGRNPERRRFKEMFGQFLLLIDGSIDLPDTAHELRELYEKLLPPEELDENSDLDGDLFRAGPVFVLDGQKTDHVGFSPETKIISGIETTLSAMHPEGASHLLSHVMAHFMFETVHPFYDGNGRMGRFLLVQGVSKVLSMPTALTLSRVLNEQKTKYYKAFEDARQPKNYGDGTLFALSMLSMLHEAQLGFREELNMRIDQIKSLSRRIAELRDQASIPNAGERTYELLERLGFAALFGWPRGEEHQDLALDLKVSPQTLRKDEDLLVAAGYVLELSKRPLTFKLSPAGRALLELDAET